MRFEFATANRIIFGPGTLREIGPLAKAFGPRALIVTGKSVQRAQPLVEVLKANDIASVTFSVTGEPKLETVEQGTAFAKAERCDFVIGFGGGSSLDAGKAIAAMLTNPGAPLDYVEIIGRGKTLLQPSAPFIAIPTTAGTGTEVTRNAVLASPEQRVKVSLRSPFMLPTVAVIDPELTYDLPPEITATTGLDALTQVIEPYVCTRANPMTDATHVLTSHSVFAVQKCRPQGPCGAADSFNAQRYRNESRATQHLPVTTKSPACSPAIRRRQHTMESSGCNSWSTI